MSKYRIIECRGDEAYHLWIKFEDGLAGTVDLSNLAGKGVFRAWKDKVFFKMVTIDKVSGTVCWRRPGAGSVDGGDDLDLDARTLRQDIEKELAEKEKTTIHSFPAFLRTGQAEGLPSKIQTQT